MTHAPHICLAEQDMCRPSLETSHFALSNASCSKGLSTRIRSGNDDVSRKPDQNCGQEARTLSNCPRGQGLYTLRRPFSLRPCLALFAILYYPATALLLPRASRRGGFTKFLEQKMVSLQKWVLFSSMQPVNGCVVPLKRNPK